MVTNLYNFKSKCRVKIEFLYLQIINERQGCSVGNNLSVVELETFRAAETTLSSERTNFNNNQQPLTSFSKTSKKQSYRNSSIGV